LKASAKKEEEATKSRHDGAEYDTAMGKKSSLESVINEHGIPRNQ